MKYSSATALSLQREDASNKVGTTFYFTIGNWNLNVNDIIIIITDSMYMPKLTPPDSTELKWMNVWVWLKRLGAGRRDETNAPDTEAATLTRFALVDDRIPNTLDILQSSLVGRSEHFE